jgi:hypothetical protein
MAQQRRRRSWQRLATVHKRLLQVLAIGTATVALCQAINPNWFNDSVLWVRQLVTTLGGSRG